MMEDNQVQKEIQSQNQLSNDEIISWGQLLSEAKDTLTKANVPDADIDAWLLMEHCFSITKSFFFLNRRQIVESKGFLITDEATMSPDESPKRKEY